MPDVMVNGTRLFYQQFGDAGPDVVLVHAVTSNQAVWVFSGLPDAIAEGIRYAVVHHATVIDLPVDPEH